MEYKINEETYNIEVVKKNNKNTYIRVKDINTISVTTNFFVSNKEIIKLLDSNIDALKKMLKNKCKQEEKNFQFYYLGIKYDIIEVPSFKEIEIIDTKIYVPDLKKFNKWYKQEIMDIFKARLDYVYKQIKEEIPYPNLKIRTMKTRWGVCNRRDTSITLNSNLMKETVDKIDYVITHELVHFIHFDHSTKFWDCVYKYYPNYKKVRKELRE